MESFNVPTIGAATFGAYFARKTAKLGYADKTVEKLRSKIGKIK